MVPWPHSSRATVPEPHVLVDDPVPALGRLARGHVDALLPGLAVVGVTGSSGKTSTKDLLAAVLEPLGPTVAPRGSLNTEVGVPITALGADPTTRHLVVEMGARGLGHIAELCRITPPRIGVVLNVGAAHAGEFGSPEATARAKSELVTALPSGADGGVAVLNADDPLVAAMSEVTAARVVRFGLSPDADVRAVDVRLDGSGRPTFSLRAGDRDPVEVTLAAARRAPRVQRAGRRRGRRSSWERRRQAWRPRWPPRYRAAGGGWRSSSGPTGSPSSTTPTTPTPTRSGPRWRR